ncbi:MAG: ATP-binding protein [Microgenomates group bacterium]
MEELIARLEFVQTDNGYRSNARESSDLEFKLELNLAAFKKCLKTIAAFANKSGGHIVFGIKDKPRLLIGIGNSDLDEAVQSEHLNQCLSPVPDIKFQRSEVHGLMVGVLTVAAAKRGPIIAIKDLQGAAGQDTILRQGLIYTRRRGQTAAISGEEFSQLMIARDETTRNEIFSLLNRGKSIGFDRVVVAEPGTKGDDNTSMTFYLPASAAKDLNVIDRARLVESNGAPAYEIQGSVQLTVPSEIDPRGPLKAKDSAVALENSIRSVFWNELPWSFSHMKKAAQNLGFWATDEGDQVNTGREQLTGTTVYYEAGRTAILNFARQNPTAFIEVVGSAKSIERWRALNRDRGFEEV